MKFNKGDIVEVKLAGLRIQGTIKSVKLTGDCIVQFESGNEQTILAKNLKLVESVKTSRIETLAPKDEKPERKSPSRLKSPTRRSPARPASPGRRTRASPSPSRKKSATVVTSPAAATSTATSTTSTTSNLKSPSIPTRILKVSLENIESKIGDSIAAGVTRRKRLRDPDSTSHHPTTTNQSKDDLEIVPHSKPMILPSKIPEYKPDAKEANRNVFMKSEQTLTAKVNDIGKFSDDDENIIETKNNEKKQTLNDERKEFVGWFGALLLIFIIPGATIALNVFCNKDSCTYRKLPNFRSFRLLSTYFDLNSFGIYAAYVTLIALISRAPYVGRTIKSQPSKENMYTYHMNGLFSAFTILGLMIALEFYNKSIVNYVFDHYFQLLISGILFGAVLSILLFIRSKFVAISQLNPHAVTYNFIYDFFMGRQVNPRVLNFDIKTILLRASNIAILILNSIFIFKSMNIIIIDSSDLLHFDNYRFDLEPALLVASILQIIYILDFLVFESNLTTTFELQYEGLGYMKVMQYSVYPFMLTSITKYLYEHGSDADDNPWILTAISLVFLAGYILYRGSNSQKNAFRLNPYDSVFQQMATLQTNKGKKLLMSGFWGKLRHPNYTGDILIHFALSACAAGSPAALSTLPISLMLAYRAVRDNNRCKQRYTSAWERYTHKVKYAIIPKIF